MELNGKAMLEGFQLHVSIEDYDYGGEVTGHKTEKGLTMTDHVSTDPLGVSLSGLLIRPTEERVQMLIDKLLNWKKNGILLQYEGRQIVPNVLIETFSYSADKETMNGFKFSMKLKQVRFAQVKYTAQTKPKTNAGQKQTQGKKSSPQYHVIKRGDNYWDLARKYGTTVKNLQTWNKYAAKSLPIGAKLRVG